MNQRSYLFTSESVSMGHPDKVADQISDAVLDAMLAQDPMSRVACETMVSTGMAVVAGEVTTKAYVEIPDIVRATIADIGYTDPHLGFDHESCAVLTSIKKQSPEIAMGVDTGGAGDQGMMFGFACKETESLMPLPIDLAHRLVDRQAEVRRNGTIAGLRPDAKSQVTVLYEGLTPVSVQALVLSTQHAPQWNGKTKQAELKQAVIEHIFKPVLGEWWNNDIDLENVHVNPTGQFEIGGPHGDCGLTGRKIIVDTYGGRGRHGGGAFSGKDPTKVDRSAAYMARYIAKNIVAAGLAEVCEVQLSYAIGVAKPTSVSVDCAGTNTVDEEAISKAVYEHFQLTPKGIIESLGLRAPIYRQSAYHGHFGRTPGTVTVDCNDPDNRTSEKKTFNTFSWEKTDKAAALKSAVSGFSASPARA